MLLTNDVHCKGRIRCKISIGAISRAAGGTHRRPPLTSFRATKPAFAVPSELSPCQLLSHGQRDARKHKRRYHSRLISEPPHDDQLHNDKHKRTAHERQRLAAKVGKASAKVGQDIPPTNESSNNVLAITPRTDRQKLWRHRSSPTPP